MVGFAQPRSLDASVLVLNKFYAPVSMTTARRAFALLFKESAEAVALAHDAVQTFRLAAWLEFTPETPGLNEDEDFVRSVRSPVRVPRIVRLTRFDRFPRTRVSFTRKNVLARDEYRCQYCGKRPCARDLTLDHVMPRSRGGRHCWTNVVACCRRCNGRKGPRLVREAGMRLKRKPEAPKVSPLLTRRLDQPRYRLWRIFVKDAGRDRR
ncbi:MAG: HNH endonuclease [Planctomycetota bacterium]|jgi:5-methylcytosine-specific restriction endonuclease McrA